MELGSKKGNRLKTREQSTGDDDDQEQERKCCANPDCPNRVSGEFVSIPHGEFGDQQRAIYCICPDCTSCQHDDIQHEDDQPEKCCTNPEYVFHSDCEASSLWPKNEVDTVAQESPQQGDFGVVHQVSKRENRDHSFVLNHLHA
jgi:hypothetical protein